VERSILYSQDVILVVGLKADHWQERILNREKATNKTPPKRSKETVRPNYLEKSTKTEQELGENRLRKILTTMPPKKGPRKNSTSVNESKVMDRPHIQYLRESSNCWNIIECYLKLLFGIIIWKYY
jgi:hypothetical protein